jgi:hypothetical protein
VYTGNRPVDILKKTELPVPDPLTLVTRLRILAGPFSDQCM